MAIKLDRSTTGIVVACDECTWWSAFRFWEEDAWDVACRHEEGSHPDDRHQRNAREQRRSRARRAGIAGMSANVRMV